MNSEKILCVHF